MKKPSVEECVQGFERILDKINPQQMMMLRAHHQSGGRAATMRELATAAGHADYKMANLQYGNLAKRLYQAMGYSKPKSLRSGNEYWILGLGAFIGRHELGLEMQCVMWTEIAEALERLGIVEASRRSDGESSDAPMAADSKEVASHTADLAIAQWSMEKYSPDWRIMEGAKKILVITGKGDSAESAHAAIIQALDAGRALEGEGIEDFSLLTQNIDGSHDLVEFHGDVNKALCLSCGHSYTPENIAEVKCGTDCPKCKGYDVILRGKRLDDDDLQLAREKALTCEFCVVAGSSDVSDPAMRIAEIAKQAGACLIEINKEETALSEIADGVVRGYPFLLFYFIVNCLPRRRDLRDLDHTAPADLTPDSNIQKPRTSQTHRIRVDFIRSFEFPFLNRLGMTFAPGKKQTEALTGVWDRDLRTDLERLSNAFRVRTLVSLLEDKEFEELQVRGFAEQCARALINLVRFPIRDVSVPESIKDFVLMAAGVVDSLKHGETVVTHCKGGLGRAGLTAACIAVAATDAEISASEAIELVREARPGAAETETQEQFVAEFEKEWRVVMVKRDQPDGNFAKTSEELLVRTDEFTEHSANFDNAQNEGRDNSAEFTTEPPAVSQQLSDKHFLLCWKEQSVLAAQSSPHPLDVVSSRQLNRVNAGDTIWIVFVNQGGELVLAGRLKAAEVVDYLTAVRRLHSVNLWHGDYYALTEEETAEKINLINLGQKALELRFKKSGSDRLTATNGKIRAQQLGSMRELTEESAHMLSEIWENAIFDFGDDNFDCDDEIDEESSEILESCRRAVNEQPESADTHYNLGVALDENDLPEEANAAYQKAILLDPNYGAAYYNLGQNYLRADKLEESKQAFKAAIRLAPEFAPARFMLGVVYGGLGDFEKAIRTTKEGLQHAPEDPMAYFNIGNFYSHLRDYKKASEWFEKSAEINPNASDTFYRLGKCYRESGEKEKEFDAYLNAVELAPDFIDALFALGVVYAHLTETDEGKQVLYFETGGELVLSDPRVSFYLGLGNLALGNVDVAQDSQNDLRKMDERIADQLQFFIDRYESENEGTKVAVEEGKAKTAGKKREPIEFYINGKSFEAKNVPEMYQKALEYMVEARLLDDVSLPIATGEKRYILAKEAVHPTGKPFLAPVAYKGFFMEAHNNREAAIAQLKKLIESVGCAFYQPSESLPKKDAFSNLEPENQPVGNDLDAIREGVKTESDTDFTRIEDITESKNKMEYGQIGTRIWYELSKGSRAGALQIFDEVKDYLTDSAKAQAERVIKINTFQGCLLGGAVGDALGTTVEFKPTGTFPRVTTITGGGPFELQAGEWTDDTSMALCLADSLIESNGFNAFDQMRRYCRWKNDGYLSSNGTTFDIGMTVRRALEKFEREQTSNESTPFCGSVSPSTAGNGSLMRLAPVPLFFANDAKKAIDYAAESSRTTHGARECIDACRYLAALIVGAVQGKSKEELLSAKFTPLPGLWEAEPLTLKVAEIAEGSFKAVEPPQIIGSIQGYVIISLHVALWAFYHTDNFADGALKAINLGYDADTYGAIYGQLAGAYYGVQSIPEDWRSVIAKRDLIESFAGKLCEASLNH